MGLVEAIVFFLVLAVSGIPLQIASKLIEGRATITRVFLVNLFLAVLAAWIEHTIGFVAAIMSFVIMLLAYKFIFNKDWKKTFQWWLLHFMVILCIVVSMLIIGMIFFGL